MCKGLIHHLLPDDTELSGIIVRLDTGHVFFMGNNLNQLEENLKATGAILTERFSGIKYELIDTIKSLNKTAKLPGYNPLARLKEMRAA